jgi:hypothetical protein
MKLALEMQAWPLLLALVNVMVPLFSGACHVFGSLAASQFFLVNCSQAAFYGTG